MIVADSVGNESEVLRASHILSMGSTVEWLPTSHHLVLPTLQAGLITVSQRARKLKLREVK